MSAIGVIAYKKVARAVVAQTNAHPFANGQAPSRLKDVAPGEKHHQDCHYNQKRHLSCSSLQKAKISLCRHDQSPL